MKKVIWNESFVLKEEKGSLVCGKSFESVTDSCLAAA
jgi:hypothetical protein